MKRIALAAGAASLVGVVVLAACSNSGGGNPKSAAGAGGGAVSNGKANAPGAAPAGPAQDAASGQDAARGPAKAAADPLLVSQALIRTADLSVEVARGTSVPAQANRAEQIAISAGGLVFSDDRTAGTAPTAALTLKVPGSALNGALGRLADLGKELSRQSSTKDVTTAVADVGSRIRSAQASIDRLRVLFGRAVKVGDVIALESELAQREADLESLQAQQRSLADQTSMATITLRLTSAAAVVTPHHKHTTGGFLGGLDRGWQAFASAAVGLAIGVGAVLPFVLLAMLVGAAVVAIRRRTRAGTPPVIPPAEGSAA